jgi:hypothetical protein
VRRVRTNSPISIHAATDSGETPATRDLRIVTRQPERMLVSLREERQMMFSRNDLFVTDYFLLLLVFITVQTRSVSAANLAERIVQWAVLALLSVATIVSMVRHRRFEPFGQDAAFREIGRSLDAIVNHF